MRTVSSEMSTWLAAAGNAAAFRADLWTITPSGMSTIYLTSADQAVSYGGHSYAAGVIFSRGKLSLSATLRADTVQVRLAGSATAWTGKTYAAAALGGYLDGAEVDLQHLIMPTWGDTSLGTIPLFHGFVSGATELTSTDVTLEVVSALGALLQPFPRRLYGPPCPYTLGDGACGYSVGTESRTVHGWDTSELAWVDVADAGMYATDYFAQGWLKFTYGTLLGLYRTIISNSDVSGHCRAFIYPRLPAAPSLSDTLLMRRGCPKTWAACNDLFSNAGRFGGFRHIPPPEIAG